jgi:hypothetical protein
MSIKVCLKKPSRAGFWGVEGDKKEKQKKNMESTNTKHHFYHLKKM